MNHEIEVRFGGIERLYGKKSFQQLCSSHVAVVGLGGVGSWVVESLARSAVGKISLFDMDEVCITNTNRQLQALTSTVGKSKAKLLQERILEINPLCEVFCIEDFVTAKTMDKYLTGDFDFIADCIDGVRHKCDIIDFSKKKNIPIISAGAAAGKTDPSLIRLEDLTRSRNDMLLTRVRKKLRQEYGFSRGDKKFKVACVYSEQLAVYPNERGEICTHVAPDSNKKRDCETGMGTATHLTGTMGFFMASFIINEIINK